MVLNRYRSRKRHAACSSNLQLHEPYLASSLRRVRRISILNSAACVTLLSVLFQHTALNGQVFKDQAQLELH